MNTEGVTRVLGSICFRVLNKDNKTESFEPYKVVNIVKMYYGFGNDIPVIFD